MKINELIFRLRQIQNELGDIDVAVDGTSADWLEVQQDDQGKPFVEIG